MPEETMTNATETAVETGNATQVETTQPQETQTTQQTPQETAQEKQERLFRQADVDRIIQDRLARERQKFETELKSHPHLTYLEGKAKRLGMTVEQLLENDRKYEEQQQIQELVQKNIPPEYAKEVLESRKFREQYQTEQQKRQQEEQRRQQYAEFLQLYPDVKADQIPVEVWQMVQQGHRLASAYAIYENKMLKDKLKGVEQQQQTQQANVINAGSSTGSVKTHGATGGFISREQFDANRHDINWVRRNLKQIEESRKHW